MSEAEGLPSSESFPSDLDTALRRELDENERLLWVGRPIPHLYARRFLLPGVWLGTFALGFTVFIAVGMVVNVRELFGPRLEANEFAGVAGDIALVAFLGFFAVATLGAAVYMYGLPIRARKRASRTVYAVTDRRAIVLVAHRNGRVVERDYCADELRHLFRRQRADGSGDLHFESAKGAAPTGSPTGSTTPSQHGFLAVRDVLGVERLLRRQFGCSDTPE